MREGIKRLLLIALVIGCFFLFDSLMDFTANNYLPALFNCVLYPIDVAGVIEYTVAFAVLSVSYKKGIEWLSTGTFATFRLHFSNYRAKTHSHSLKKLFIAPQSTKRWCKTMSNKSGYMTFQQESPEIAGAFNKLIEAIAKPSALDGKTKQLMYIAMKIVTDDVGAAFAHVMFAKKMGASTRGNPRNRTANPHGGWVKRCKHCACAVAGSIRQSITIKKRKLPF